MIDLHHDTMDGTRQFIIFGPFELDVFRQSITCEGLPIRLGGRAISILTILLEAEGGLVEKADLVRRVWPNVFVEENNLRVQMATLRKALGDDGASPRYIANVQGRGYRFIGMAHRRETGAAPPPVSRVEPMTAPTPPPAVQRHLFGRERELITLGELLGSKRLVSIVGPGGVGKTSLALAAAAGATKSDGDVCFIDLSVVSEAGQIPFAIAAAMNIAIQADTPTISLTSMLRARSILAILDNCEHIIEGVAQIVNELMRGAPFLRILTTTHESLGMANETVLRVGPLSYPQTPVASVSEAMEYPAVALLVERLINARPGLQSSDLDPTALVDICRHLDGLPLALEIAAANADIFSVAELAVLLGNTPLSLVGSKRTAAARHQTLSHLLAWARDLLQEHEARVLGRLSIFVGEFDLRSALNVAKCEVIDESKVASALESLVRKSLLFPSMADDAKTYRMLASTRQYASKNLDNSSEGLRVRSLHAEQLCASLEGANEAWTTSTQQSWIARYRYLLGDIRAVLGWSLIRGENIRLGVRLAGLSIQLGHQLGLMDEFRAIGKAAAEAALTLDPPDTVAEMRLVITNAILDQNINGPSAAFMMGIRRAQILAESTGSLSHKLEPEISLAAYNLGLGNYEQAMSSAQTASEYAKACQIELAVLGANRILAQACVFAGQYDRAKLLAHSVVSHPAIHIPYAYGNVQTDKRVSMGWVTARALWAQGFPDQARELAEEVLSLAVEDSPQALSQALALCACPIALWCGDNEKAERWNRRLLSHSVQYGLGHWQSWSDLFADVLALRGGNWRTGVEVTATGDLQASTLTTFTGQIQLNRPVSPDDWSAPELLRAKAEVHLVRGDTTMADALLRDSLMLSRRHGAVAWELRTLTTLAKTTTKPEQRRRWQDQLAALADGIPEGHDTTDWRAAAVWCSA